MLVVKCDICGAIEDQKTNSFRLETRTDICLRCVKLLGKAAELLSVKDFDKQLEGLHKKFFPGSSG